MLMYGDKHHHVPSTSSGNLAGRRVPEHRIEGYGRNKKAAGHAAAVKAVEYLAQCGILKTRVSSSQPPSTAASTAEDDAAALLAELGFTEATTTPPPRSTPTQPPAQPCTPPPPMPAMLNTLDHEITVDDVEDMTEEELRVHLKRALREIQALQAQWASMAARVRRAASVLTDSNSLLD